MERLAKQSAEAATMLRALANQQRLLILCQLSAGELSVSELHRRMALSQSALSQHLARLREEGLVAFRRDAQTLIYRVGDERVARLLTLLHELYCPAPGTEELP